METCFKMGNDINVKNAKDYLENEWKTSDFISKNCNCGAKKDVCYERAFLFGYKEKTYANIWLSVVNKLKKEYMITWEEIQRMVIEVVKDDMPIKSIGIKAPGDCACSNVPPLITASG